MSIPPLPKQKKSKKFSIFLHNILFFGNFYFLVWKISTFLQIVLISVEKAAKVLPKFS
jgi:hypothetical protein